MWALFKGSAANVGKDIGTAASSDLGTMDTSDGGATSQDVQSVKLVNDDHATGAAGASNTTPVEKWSNGDATSIDLSVSVNEEDIDPFTYRPPFTKWDYLKVRI